MKSALKKSVVSTSISLILASGMAAFAAHAADDVKLKATKTNVAKRPDKNHRSGAFPFLLRHYGAHSLREARTMTSYPAFQLR